MRYIPNTDQDRRQMLEAIGVASVADLFADVPTEVRLKRPLRVPPALSEAELTKHLRALAGKNADADRYSTFLGAGCYHHFSPAIINHLVLRGEFLTAYTPYQPEISQGTLQALYEYQTLICLLTGMDVSNASMYEGASATAEGILMAQRVTGRSEVVVSRAVHPEYRRVARTYTSQIGISFKEIPFTEAGVTDADEVKGALTDRTACLVVQSPNFFGGIEDLGPLAELAHAAGALLVVCVSEPIALGILKPPGEFGADIVSGEGQGLGTGMNYGGPALGFFATRERFVRHMPGRLVGQTLDREGRTGYVLTLATREQHIRREKATSNICTSESLIALMATIYLVSLGPQGLREMALTNLRKAAYAKERLSKVRGFGLRFTGPTFNEFVLQTKKKLPAVLAHLFKRQIVGGLELSRYFPELSDCLLVCVTEQNSREEIDALAKALGGVR
ncbi:MAG TPA: aminomethyl-transferring glycine dehydrogenase subunit GcvPA [Candidatus Methylomirabilis sp.]|nr:aminomethyl-transferring glycine dehydrogenase subunit GcvPA [Candidatus Methylomirabilis sp.]